MDDTSAIPAAPPAMPAEARRVLVLQGGGALGSYQAGAYKALCAHGFEPDWVAGISIGAINAAIIAGNPRELRVPRLKEFWDMVSAPVPWMPKLASDHGRSVFNEASAATVAAFGVPGFFMPRFPPAQFLPSSRVDNLSYYDTAPLRATLERLIDFDRINAGVTRLSVGAVNIKTGNFAYFDNARGPIGPEHIMASGALPPGLPAVEIDGEFYWDGGIASNTPLDYVLDQNARDDLLIFQVDLFSARGPLPTTLLEVAEREKDIRYSSRTRLNTDLNKRIRHARRALRALIAKLPDDLKSDPSVAILNEAAKENSVTVVHLIYRRKTHQSSSKDYDFSRLSVHDHWRAGEEDVHRSVRNPEKFIHRPHDDTMVALDLTPQNGNAGS
jgi:NTE family protein